MGQISGKVAYTWFINRDRLRFISRWGRGWDIPQSALMCPYDASDHQHSRNVLRFDFHIIKES